MQIEAAVADVLNANKALCKFISRNDVGATGAHQAGFYLPKSAWQMFTPQPPQKGINDKHPVVILWPDGRTTESMVTWYGKAKNEYRLTCFGKDFPWLREDLVGSLLVLVPFSLDLFHAFVLETDEDIEAFQASLGVETLGGWGVFSGGQARVETEDECLERVFKVAVAPLDDFPDGNWMATRARSAVDECARRFSELSADDQILKWVKSEYQLFRAVEQKLCLKQIQQPFQNVDQFISVANPILQRRKSRAGHSLEHHVEHLLSVKRIQFDSQPRIDGKVRPDLLIPGKAAYDDPSFPVSELTVVGIKTTCKDRWRQILNEGKRIREKHLLTLQEAISADQLCEMRDANVTLVVPKAFHKGYDTNTGVKLLSIEAFVDKLSSKTGAATAALL